MDTINRPDIYAYDNYREYLENALHYLKQSDRKISLRSFSTKAGFRSAGYIKTVIEGKKNLSESSISKVAKALNLNQEEFGFFRKLVSFNQTHNLEDKHFYAGELLKEKRHSKYKPMSASLYEFYSHWHHIPILVLIGMDGFIEDHKLIAESLVPNISMAEVKKAIKNLEILNLIQRNSFGKLEPVQTKLNTKNEVYSAVVANYHKKMIEMGRDSIDLFERFEREISSVSLKLNKSDFLRLKNMLQEYREEVMSIKSDSDGSEEVYQLNFQLFPLTNRSKK